MTQSPPMAEREHSSGAWLSARLLRASKYDANDCKVKRWLTECRASEDPGFHDFVAERFISHRQEGLSDNKNRSTVGDLCDDGRCSGHQEGAQDTETTGASSKRSHTWSKVEDLYDDGASVSTEFTSHSFSRQTAEFSDATCTLLAGQESFSRQTAELNDATSLSTLLAGQEDEFHDMAVVHHLADKSPDEFLRTVLAAVVRATVAKLHSNVVVSDANGRVIAASENFIQLTEQPREEMEGGNSKAPSEVCQVSSEQRRRIDHATETGSPFTGVFVSTGKAGDRSLKLFDLRNTIIGRPTGSDQEIWLRLGCQMDVTTENWETMPTNLQGVLDQLSRMIRSTLLKSLGELGLGGLFTFATTTWNPGEEMPDGVRQSMEELDLDAPRSDVGQPCRAGNGGWSVLGGSGVRDAVDRLLSEGNAYAEQSAAWSARV